MACHRVRIGDAVGIVCTRGKRQRCQTPNCSAYATRMCDFRLETTKRCDRYICEAHAQSGKPGVDFCPAHARLRDGVRRDPSAPRERFEVRAVDEVARKYVYCTSFRLFHDACLAADAVRKDREHFVVWDSTYKRVVYDSRLLEKP